jgi:hypothetical protein
VDLNHRRVPRGLGGEARDRRHAIGETRRRLGRQASTALGDADGDRIEITNIAGIAVPPSLTGPS